MQPLEHPASDAILLNPDDKIMLLNAYNDGLEMLNRIDEGRMTVALRTTRIGDRLIVLADQAATKKALA